VLHDRSAHPVDLRIPPDGLVVRIDHDDLKVFVGRILANPIRVEDTEALKSAADTFLGD